MVAITQIFEHEPFEPRRDESRERAVWARNVSPGRMRVLLVTDMVDFTPMVQRLGDREAQQVIQAHNRLLRGCLQARDGTEVTHTGDGMIAAFDSVHDALLCAVVMQKTVTRYANSLRWDWPLRIRVGIHAGEPLPEEGRLFGLCVNIAVRVCLLAEGSAVLVSDVVRRLASESPLPFSQYGLVPLKGIASPLHLHELLWRSALA